MTFKFLAIMIFLSMTLLLEPPLLEGAGIPRSPRWIGSGTPYATPFFVFKAEAPGPVVLIEAGIHGDEIAGVLALDRLLPRFRVHAGTLIILPRMNRPAVEADKRSINVDLNKVFPGRLKASVYERQLAREIFDLVGHEQVEYVVTLHESRYLHTKDQPKTFGQTIVYGVKPMPAYLPAWLTSLNNGLSGKQKFHPYYCPVVGSSTETMVETYHLKGGFCVETWRGFDLETRVMLQEKIVLEFLNTIGFKYSLNRGPAAKPGM